ncbi:M23 family metallopeptidase [Massilia endophytica]|uniref:M23 family metallopeptidase n=1 Tax=Massilia endophytica TaxID=2899220 RepID=UPI001E299FF6|nr:M23 family metallopeptidase [Massilia endophytica]UGQ45063.1 M23 family metallopeptidase [Massilia endophytica]
MRTILSKWSRVAGLAVMLVAAWSAQGAERDCKERRQSEIRHSLDMAVRTAPVAVPNADGASLRYELGLTNFSWEPLTLTRLEVLDARTQAVIHQAAGEKLAASIGPYLGAPRTSPELIKPGQTVIVYLDIALPGAAPAAVRHRVHLSADVGGQQQPYWIEAASTQVDASPLPVLGPPLKGGPWVAVYDPQMERGHRRTVFTLNGTQRIPGRYAIDWMLAAPASGRPPKLGGGAEVLAVADAKVAAVHDGVPEPAPGTDPRRTPFSGAPGNFIVLDLGNGKFATYEHLSPGLLVKPGDPVRRGQLIARIGTTGHAVHPHLHFHLGDSADPLLADGLPFLVDGMKTAGVYDTLGMAVSGGAWREVPAAPVRATFPAANSVVHFPADD